MRPIAPASHPRWLILGFALAFATTTFEEARAQELSLNPLGGLSKDTLKNFRDRPLFNPARSEPHATDAQAAPTAVQAVPPSLEPPPELHLVGVVSGDHDLAVVRLANSGKTTTLATGDKVGTWTITVLPAGVRLEADTRRVDITLFAPKAAPAQPSPGGAADVTPPMADHPPPADNPTP